MDVRIKELYIQDGTDVLQCAGSAGDLRFYYGTFYFTEFSFLILYTYVREKAELFRLPPLFVKEARIPSPTP